MLELAQDSDLETVNQIAKQGYDLYVSWRPDIYENTDMLYSSARLISRIRDRELYVAKLNGETVGYTLLHMITIDHPGFVNRKVMRIIDFCVEESWRNQGVGKAMMADIRALARAFRCTDIQIDVYPQNDEAVSFCQKCGLTIQNIVMSTKI